MVEIRKQVFDKCVQDNAKARNKEHINKTTAGLIEYYSDPRKAHRTKESHLCRYCYYFATARIGGCAMTTVGCGNCGKEMTFASTFVDRLCDECVAELKACKHCGQKMD